MSKDKENSAQEQKTQTRYSRQSLLASRLFRGRRDLLAALLSEDKQYTLREAEDLLRRAMKGRP